MKKLLPVLVLCGAFGSDLTAFAQSAPSKSTTSPRPAAATTLSQTGTIQSFDPATRVLSFSTSKGIEQLTLSPTARIRESSRKIDAAGLTKLVGHRATIRYSDSSGSKVVESLRVAGGKTRKS
jgi:hypothetical protein